MTQLIKELDTAMKIIKKVMHEHRNEFPQDGVKKVAIGFAIMKEGIDVFKKEVDSRHNEEVASINAIRVANGLKPLGDVKTC